MTLQEVITYIKSIRPDSPFKDETFLVWINDLEADIYTKVFLLDPANFVAHKATTESVLADATHTKIYWLYLSAMIDFANGEFSRYNDSISLFNGTMSDYKCWYAKKYHPADGLAQTSGYYISAYSIAVKYGYSGSEAEWATFIQANATAAQNAQIAAETAKTAAETAANTATTKANEVVVNSTSAAEKATAAANSAAAAALSAQSAAEKATAAANSALAAANSVTTAGNSASAAETAKAAAETAKTAAESAKTAAETAKNLAETAKAAAEIAKTDAVNANTAAQSAKTAAETAKSLAETANTAAQGAKTAAEAAKTATESAKNNAETSANNAEAWSSGTIGGVAVPSTHPAYNNNSKYYKEQAQSIVGGDYPTKSEAQGYVNTHNSSAEAHAAKFATKQEVTNSLVAETALADADVIPFYDASASAHRKTLWSNIKSVLKTFFDTLYASISHVHVWGDISGKPTTFAPSSHNHAAGDINTGNLSVANGGTGATNAAGARTNLGAVSEELSATVATALGLDPAGKPKIDDALTCVNMNFIDIRKYYWIKYQIDKLVSSGSFSSTLIKSAANNVTMAVEYSSEVSIVNDLVTLKNPQSASIDIGGNQTNYATSAAVLNDKYFRVLDGNVSNSTIYKADANVGEVYSNYPERGFSRNLGQARVVVNKTLLEVLSSYNSNAYPSGEQNGFTYYSLGKILPTTHIEIGSYVGSGTCGVNNKTRIPTTSPAKFVFVSSNGGEYQYYPNFFVFPQTTAPAKATASVQLNITWGDKFVEFYCTDNASCQMNALGRTYYYFILG